METKGKRAILLGGSGLVGGRLLHQLLADPAYTEIRTFGRGELPLDHPKLQQYVVDLKQAGNYQTNFKGDVVFCCVGTTRAKTPDLDQYREVDYGIPLEAAGAAKVSGIPAFAVISSLGADPDSRLFYNRIKGEMERDLMEVGLSQLYILQPSLIGGGRSEFRLGERMAVALMRLIGPLLRGKLARYRVIDADIIAACLRGLGLNPIRQTRIPSEDIQKLGRRILETTGSNNTGE